MDPYIPSRQSHTSIRMAEVLAAFSLATDLGAGKSMGHAVRACALGMALAGELRLPDAEQAELYYSFLLMHSGCTVLSLGLAPVIQGDELAAIGDITLRDDADPQEMLEWMRKNVSLDVPLPRRAFHMISMMLHTKDASESKRGACEVAFQVAQRLGLPPGVQDAVRCYLERWDGKGPFGLVGNAIPIKARLLHLALKIEAAYSARGQNAAENLVIAQKGKVFDPNLVEVFQHLAKDDRLWKTLSREDFWNMILDLEPNTSYQTMDEAQLDNIVLAVADFVDLKSPRTVGHSRETAKVAEGMARRMGMPPSEVANIRRAALVHDLGHIALPGHILLNTGSLSEADQEKLRLHPYYTERILSRVPALSAVAAIAGKHHERLNGTGYYRGLSGKELPVSACILALADEFEERLHPHSGLPEPDPKEVLDRLRPETGTLYSRECFEALEQELGFLTVKAPRRHVHPAGLTDREVEVLQQLAGGANNRQIAQVLVVSEKTVAHHLEHIYNKIGVSSRAAAVFFAMEHELIS